MRICGLLTLGLALVLTVPALGAERVVLVEDFTQPG
jgi:hypothetical protein